MEMEQEIWKAYPLNCIYMVSNLGNVFDRSRNRAVSVQIRKDGYAKVSMTDYSKGIYESGRNQNPFLHRVVAITFHPNPNNLPEVRHKDRNKLNNREDNLEWSTHQDNIIHSFRCGDNKRITPKGKDHWNYGKKYGEDAKRAMSLEKIGEKHPKFKGYYCKNGIQYPSARQAAILTGENQKTIIRRSHKKQRGWSFVSKDDKEALKSIKKTVDFEVTNTPAPASPI